MYRNHVCELDAALTSAWGSDISGYPLIITYQRSQPIIGWATCSLPLSSHGITDYIRKIIDNCSFIWLDR